MTQMFKGTQTNENVIQNNTKNIHKNNLRGNLIKKIQWSLKFKPQSHPLVDISLIIENLHICPLSHNWLHI